MSQIESNLVPIYLLQSTSSQTRAVYMLLILMFRLMSRKFMITPAAIAAHVIHVTARHVFRSDLI